MIVLTSERGAAIFVMLTEQDCCDMRGGRTKTVDHRYLQGTRLNQIIVSLNRSNDEIISMIAQSSPQNAAKVREMPPEREPEATEGRCEGCRGLMEKHQLLNGKCMMCWREQCLYYKQRIQALGGEVLP
jgi:hypothetical protein